MFNKQHKMSNTKIYSVWEGIKQRCNNVNNISYKHYGGRGITICKEWTKFINFYNWAIYNGYNDAFVIDRKNNDIGYCPENCQWITQAENVGIGKRRKNKNNTSGFVGVHFHKTTGKWRAVLYNSGKILHLGLFESKESAKTARINKEIELFGEQKTNR